MQRSVLVLVFLFSLSLADVYMHHPRGSNNRLNEQSAERNNGDRLCDTQNNNRGGYNCGDKSNTAFDGNNPYQPPVNTFSYTTPGTNGYNPMQYQNVYFEGSTLDIEWTNQHGCGGHEGSDEHKLNCEMIIQYMCETDPASTTVAPTPDLKVYLYDGGNTNTPDEPNSFSGIASTKASNDANQRGRHESEGYYFMCKRRERNFGLFHADQNLNGDTTQYTRQNNNGNRRGLECPEERDYYPWWNPSPWIDIAVLTAHPEFCNTTVLPNSQNNNPVGYCDGLLASGQTSATRPNTIPISPAACAARGGQWTTFNKNLSAPYCGQGDWSRVNHLGNGRHAQPLTYNWTLPAFSDLVTYGVNQYTFTSTGGVTQTFAKCVMRLRYNISTDDYDPQNTNSSFDENTNSGITSPIQQNPDIDIGSQDKIGLRLALNTNQYGRTFQDRSHVFYIAKRPTAFQGMNILNLCVRGKRGNIVQTFPSVEYDFVPNRVHIASGSLIHIQWTGSNTHNNGNPAGDGQAGDAGQGTGGTDRHNFVQIGNMNENYPLPLDKYQNDPNLIFNNVNCYNYDATTISDWVDCALLLATSGQYRTKADVSADTNTFDPLLNNAPASLVGGIVLELKTSSSGKTFNYMSTRNNNFSNRGQKGTILVQ